MSAGEVSISGSATLSADPQTLQGEITLELLRGTSLYDLRAYAVSGAGSIPLSQRDYLSSTGEHRFRFALERSHRAPGRYHLLLEVRFRDAANQQLAVNLHFPYSHGEMAVSDSPPLLQIEGQRLHWGESPAGGEILSVDLPAGPSWLLAGPVALGAESFDMRPLPGALSPPSHIHRKLAVLNWLDGEGYHHSRVIPWEIRTDLAGNWIREPSRGAPGLPAGPLPPLLSVTLALALALAICGFYFYRRRQVARLYALFKLAALLALALWMANYLHMELWFTETWPTGGDLASHVLYANVFRDWLFAGRITGWMPEVFAGFPAFRFYFPLPFILISLLSIIVPIQVAIKVVVMLPGLLLPLAAYWMAGRFRWPDGARLFAALACAAFVLHGGSSVWGGNFLAQLSGEFSYSWGILFTLLFWGSLHRALREGGRSWLAPALLEALIGFSHGYPLLVAGFSALLMPLFFEHRRKALFTVLRVHLVAFLLLGFWLLPLIENLPHTIPNDSSVWEKGVDALLPASLRPLLLGLPFLLYELCWRREESGALRFLSLVAAMSLLAYAGAWAVGLLDIRFFPFIQLCLAIACGAALGLFFARRGDEVVGWAFSVSALLLMNYWLSGLDRLEQWSGWGMEGYERKVMWTNYRALADHLSGELSGPRVIFEHDPANHDIGSTRAMEALPLFGSRPVLEGLYMESAITGPFVYQLQAEISRRPSSPLSRFPAVKGISGDIADRLQDFYVDTVVLRSRQSKELLAQHPDFELTENFGPLAVYKARRVPALISVESDLEFTPPRRDWIDAAFRRYLLQGGAGPRVVSTARDLVPAGSAPAGGQAQIQLREFTRDSIRFTTDKPGWPHLVRITYHPAWVSLGGEMIHRADPAFMLLVPRDENVELRFGRTPGQTLGLWFSLAGLLLLLFNPFAVPALAAVGATRWWSASLAIFLGLTLLAQALHPNRSYLRGQALLAQEDYIAAATHFESAINKRKVGAPRSEALFWAGRSREYAGQNRQARGHYTVILEQHPESYWAPESMYRLARIHADAGNSVQSEALLNLLQSRFPGNRWARRSLR